VKKIAFLAVLALLVGSVVAACNGGGDGGVTNGDGDGGNSTPAPAEFRVSNLVVAPAEVEVGESVTIRADVENIGEVGGTYTATLKIDGVEVETKDIVVAAADTEMILFEITEDAPGTYTVSLDGLTATFEVTAVVVVLFSDDFSTESSGWDVFTYGGDWAAYENGWFHIRDSLAAGTTHSLANRNFTDFIIEVDMKLIAGTDDNWQSVMFRVNGNSYYSAEISADGWYEMQLWLNGTLHMLVVPTQSIHILQGQGVVNSVRIECVGSRLSLSVNGHLLAEVTDGSLQSGDIGLEVNALNVTFTEVAFDNLVVYAP